MNVVETVARTEHLRLRRFAQGDRSNLMRLDSDPEVMRFISGGVPSTEPQIDAAMERVLGYYEKWPVFGVWAAELKDSGEFIGWFSLKPLIGAEEIEIGYRLMRGYWGRGYATEGARAMMFRGFETAALDRIAAIIDPKNLASKRVLEKIGMRYEREMEYRYPGDDAAKTVDLFAIRRRDWLSSEYRSETR